MSPARVRAQQRLQAFEQAHPTAARLARYASLAVRLDAGLLRRLRLQLLPASQASDEADLWFSDLSESRDGEALVLHPHVAAMLRDALAQEQLPGGRRALDIAFQLTQQAHRDWPASLQLEEELSYLALRDGDNAAPAIEHKLRPVLAALASGSARGIEIARWAKRALPRLPQVVRNSDAARAIGLATIAHIGSEGEVLAGLTDQTLPAQLEWLLPHDALKGLITLACELGAGSLCLRAPAADDDPALLIELPKTRPLILALQVSGGGPARLLALQVGVPVAIDSAWRQLELRCLNGETYRVERQKVAEHATAPRFDHDLFISYAHSDDQSAVEGQAGWVTHLAATLESVLATRLGRRPKIWRDRKLVDRESGPHDEETTGNLQRSALMLAVVSPHYVRSAWCLNELKVFQQAAEASGGLRVGKGFSRLIKLMKLPVDGGLPPGLQETAGYTFFEGNGSDGRAHELDPAAFDQDRLAFMKKVSHLGFELAQMLDQMSLPSAASTGVEPLEPEPKPKPEPEPQHLRAAQRAAAQLQRRVAGLVPDHRRQPDLQAAPDTCAFGQGAQRDQRVRRAVQVQQVAHGGFGFGIQFGLHHHGKTVRVEGEAVGDLIRVALHLGRAQRATDAHAHAQHRRLVPAFAQWVGTQPAKTALAELLDDQHWCTADDLDHALERPHGAAQTEEPGRFLDEAAARGLAPAFVQAQADPMRQPGQRSGRRAAGLEQRLALV